MKSLRSVASAVVVIVALLGASVAPAVAALDRPVCASQQHACCKGPKLTPGCCRDGQPSQTDSLPGQARVELRVDFTPLPAILDTLPAPAAPELAAFAHSSSPHSPPVDRPTLFSSLLI